jgi:hypothetical protein
MSQCDVPWNDPAYAGANYFVDVQVADAQKHIEKCTADARRSVGHARMAAGEPWQDDSDRDIQWLAAEAQAILARLQDRIAYDEWKRKHWLTWRWRERST